MNRKQEVVYVFIDASNLWQAQKSKGRMFDYEKLKKFLKKRFHAIDVQVFYYTAYPADGTREYSLDSKHKFLTYLKKGLGFIRKEYLGALPRGKHDLQGRSDTTSGILGTCLTIATSAIIAPFSCITPCSPSNIVAKH